jgi:hypothetical protein
MNLDRFPQTGCEQYIEAHKDPEPEQEPAKAPSELEQERRRTKLLAMAMLELVDACAKVSPQEQLKLNQARISVLAILKALNKKPT